MLDNSPEPLGTPVGGSVACSPAFVNTASDDLLWWDDPGATWRKVTPWTYGGAPGPYLPLAGGNLTGPLTSSSTGTFNGLLQANAFRAGGNNIGGLSWSGLNSQWNTLANSGAMGLGWNYSNGGGETDFFINRDGGGTGGLNVYDFPNSSGTPTLLVAHPGTGAMGVATQPPSDATAGSIFAAMLITSGGSSLAANAYLASGVWKLLTTGAANAINLVGGNISFFTAPSGAAGATPAWALIANMLANGNFSIGGNNLYFAGVTSGVGPKMYADTTSMAWQTGSGNGSYVWYNNPGNALATLDNTGYFTANNSVSTGGDLVLNRTTNAWGYLLRPNTAGYKNLSFACVGATALDQVQINSGLTTVTGQLTVNNSIFSTGSNAALFYDDRGGGSQWAWYGSGAANLWNNTVGDLLHFDTNRAIYPSVNNAGLVGASGFAFSGMWSYVYQNASDIKHKTDLADLPDCLPLVTALHPQRFRWVDGPDTERTHWGFVAQDVGRVMSDAGHDFGGHTDDPEGQGIAYHELTAVLWKACQEMADRLTALEKGAARQS